MNIPEILDIGFDDLKQAIPLHEHKHLDSYEFVFIEKGITCWEVGKNLFETRAGEVFYTLPNEVHNGRYNVIEPCRLWWLSLRIPTVSTGKWLTLEVNEVQHIISNLALVPRVSKVGMQAVRHLKRIKSAFQRQDVMSGVEIRIAVLEFLLNLMNQKPPQSIPLELVQAMKHIQTEMSTRMDWQPSLQELARIAEVSPSYFYKMFQAYTGLTPKVYLDNFKFSEASRLLANTDMSVTEIAFILGFNSTQYFATTFRRLKGQTPTHFRKNTAF